MSTKAEQSYRDTLNLLSTDFAMRGDLAKREPEMLARWEEEDLQGQIEKRHAAAKRRFMLHDGPPYANGHLHLGHALNKSLKDFVVRHKTMTGHASPYIPGWDCHGLPIEHQVIKQLGDDFRDRSVTEVRKLCHDYAMKFVGVQREEFKRLGIGGKWDDPYLTLAPVYEVGILKGLREAVTRGHIYRGLKPVFWDPIYRTALAEAELEYHDDEDPSIFVKFPVRDADACEPLKGRSNPAAVIWTTTPWTLPGNLGVCLHPVFRYAVVKSGDDHFVVARERVEAFAKECKLGAFEIVAEAKGEVFAGLKCAHPMFEDRDSVVILGEHVTLETGTGCVHTAPGHGLDDHIVGLKNDLPVFVPVDEAGRFTADYPPLEGQKVLSSNETICDDLRARGLLLAQGKLVHSYPHSWRTKKKVIMRATTQWFMRMGEADEPGSLRSAALGEIDKVQWVPPWGRDRIRGMIEQRPDWCLSRQRSWGVPIPAVTCEGCGEAHLEVAILDKVIEAVGEKGTDVWFSEPVGTWLPGGYACSKCGGSSFRSETDILDVWFDSGSSFIALEGQHPELEAPYEMYLEGSDQHRGWFQSSLLVGMSAASGAPYGAVLTHGFTLDGDGKAMSKSAGNAMSPEEIVSKFGADVLRLWVASADYRDDMRLSPDILKQAADAYRRLRNTFRFLLINVGDFDPKRDMVERDKMRALDRHMLDRLANLAQRVIRAYDEYEYHKVFHLLHQLCAVDLSSLYLDAIKDRLYCERRDDTARRAAQTVAWHCLDTLLRLIAPIIPFTSDEAWRHRPALDGDSSSVHLADFPTVPEPWSDSALAENWRRILEVRGEVTKAIEEKRAAGSIGKSLEAKVTVSADAATRDALGTLPAEELAELFIVSAVEVAQGGALNVTVSPADGEKCARCWRVQATTGESAKFPGTCRRCSDVLESLT